MGRKKQHMVSHAMQCLARFQMHPCQQLIISSASVWWSAQQAHPWLPWLTRQRYCQYKAKFGTPSSCLDRKTIISNTLLHKYLAFCAGDEPRAEINPRENQLQCEMYGASKQDSWGRSAGQWFLLTKEEVVGPPAPANFQAHLWSTAHGKSYETEYRSSLQDKSSRTQDLQFTTNNHTDI